MAINFTIIEISYLLVVAVLMSLAFIFIHLRNRQVLGSEEYKASSERKLPTPSPAGTKENISTTSELGAPNLVTVSSSK